ncbi:cation diffusion facilitator family transporter [Mahella australiensis]|uniref:Cation diffusion facilitator family transporter n=1 Tax=Mahella australiensis (strain DSM 15567 / CIP 107919 / 50-1 BON) TaxID=697281 RepID=F3ZYW8_MAHA5|nr:cation diffusion facilitator family transporter [Mahella australiensis]AEE95713.1 cation diffusion facilitator family transporter [Mahella australiensis 50-1 BON]
MEDKHSKNQRASRLSLIANIMLAILKLMAGILANSTAMIADAANSIGDILTGLITLWGVKTAANPADDEHPYGHEKTESLAAWILAIILIITGGMIIYRAVTSLSSGPQIPGMMAIIAAVITIIVKEALYRYTIKVADETKSTALMATAWDHRSDVLATSGVLVGITGAMIGWTFLDPVTGIIMALIIIRAGIKVLHRSVDELLDSSAGSDVVDKIKQVVLSVSDVVHIDDIKTRQYGSTLMVDISISVNEDMTVAQGHDVAEEVKASIMKAVPEVKDVQVHVEPYSA